MKPSEEPLISVIIPIYNVEQYLKRCVDSVLSQTYTNLEIWLVDDGSTDGCGGICDEYAEKDERIRVIHKENGGLSNARNTALDRMNGEYVTFVDSDDFIRNDMIEELLRILSEYDADMAICGFESGKNDFFRNNRKSDYTINIWKDDTKFDCLFDDKYRNFIACACGKLYKAFIFEGIRYPEGKIHEDEFTIHYIIEKCKKIVTVDGVLYYHFERQGSITKSNYSLRSLDAVEAMEDRYRFFEQNGNDRLTVLCYKDYLRRVQFHYYSVRKYYPEQLDTLDYITEKYEVFYKKIKLRLSLLEKIRYKMFLTHPMLNSFVKQMLGARRV